MKKLRLVATAAIVFLFVVLALFTDHFWWFQGVRDWRAALDDWGGGKEQMTTACLWATVHGILSIMGGTLLCLTTRKPFHSPKKYGLALLGCSATSATFLAITDVGSGWWMLVEGGRYIPLCYTAFLQPFLAGYLIAILCIPGPHNKPPRQIRMRLNNQAAS